VITIRTVDAHVAGAPLRLVVDGFPSAAGRTMAEKRRWAARRADHLRRVLMLEPRGHADMFGALLTEPTQPGSDAGLLFMNTDGFGAMSGHSVMAAATMALERGLLMVPERRALAFDTPAGTVRVRVQRDDVTGRVTRVWLTNVPSFVVAPGIDVPLPGRRLKADVAFGGAFYAIVDAESAGVVVDGTRLGDLRRIGIAVAEAVAASFDAVHPADPSIAGITGTVFTAPPQVAGADLRSVTVFAGGGIDRSPGGTGTAAVMAVLDAMGLLAEDTRFVSESLTGLSFEGTVVGRTRVGSFDAVSVEISGIAHITGSHEFIVGDDDPLREGLSFR
jgi:proline racemase